jgi:hypothetical protein
VPDGEEPVVGGARGEGGKRKDEGEAEESHGERINHGWTRMSTDEMPNTVFVGRGKKPLPNDASRVAARQQ